MTIQFYAPEMYYRALHRLGAWWNMGHSILEPYVVIASSLIKE